MAILEKEVWVGLAGGNVKYFEEKGYVVPRYINKQGILKIKKGTKILVAVKDLPKNSASAKLTKICDDCEKPILKKQTYQTILISRENGDGKDRCEDCGYRKAGATRRDNVKYNQSLEYLSIKNDKEYLLKEFSNKNIKLPNEIAYNSNDKFQWNCPKCESEYSQKLNNRTSNKQNCPFCAGRQVNHTNCLWSKNPTVARLLTHLEDGYKFTIGSRKTANFTCPHCKFKQNKSICNVVRQGFSCSKCSDGLSYPEKFVTCLLNQLNVEFEMQKTFDWSMKKRYDFYIQSSNMIIETHGIQHYSDKGFGSFGGRTFIEEKENDEYKMQLAKLNGTVNYIILDCRESSLQFIENSILNSDLNKIYDLNKIDFLIIDEYACNSNLIKEICDLWNNGLENTVEIGKIVKLDRTTVAKYLKQGVKLGWCNYDAKKVMVKIYQEQGIKNKERNSIKIVQLTKKGEYLNTWDSATEAANELGIQRSSISAICRGSIKNKTAGGFIWMLSEDYEKLITDNAI